MTNLRKDLDNAIDEGARSINEETISRLRKGTEAHFLPPVRVMSKYAMSLSLLDDSEIPELIKQDELFQNPSQLWKYKMGSHYIRKHSDTPKQVFIALMSYLIARFDFRAELLVRFFHSNMQVLKFDKDEINASLDMKDFELLLRDYIPRVSCVNTDNIGESFSLDGKTSGEIWERIAWCCIINLPQAYYAIMVNRNLPDISDRYIKAIKWGFNGKSLLMADSYNTCQEYFKKTGKMDEAIIAMLSVRSINYLNMVFQKKEKFLLYEALTSMQKSIKCN